jgi:hypothetical protein
MSNPSLPNPSLEGGSLKIARFASSRRSEIACSLPFKGSRSSCSLPFKGRAGVGMGFHPTHPGATP